MKLRELQEVESPNLLDDVFPHTMPPRIIFDGKIHEEIDGEIRTFDPAALKTRDIWISDTTFRDGQQSRPPFTIRQTVDIFDMLSTLSGPNGVIRQSEFFLYNAKDREAVEACLAQGHQFPEVTGWIRADHGDLELVKQLGLRETGVLTSSSDYHIFYKARKDRRKMYDHYVSVVEAAAEAGIRVRCHLEDVTRADIEGFVVPFVQRVAQISEQLPEDMRAKIRLCDTMGFGICYPGAALPRSVPKLIYRMINDCGIPSDRLEWHGHNDFHKVLVNCTAAWVYGCDIANTTLFGIGERTGNPPMEGAIFEYAGLKDTLDGMETRVLADLADYFQKEVGYDIPLHQPFVGANFNCTRAGIHADGLLRDERVYNIFDTGALLGKPPRVTITDKSGADGVALWVNDFLGLKGKGRLGKIKLVKIMRWVDDQYKAGRITAISDEELGALVKEYFPEQYAARPQG